jgi:hypothetical protein
VPLLKDKNGRVRQSAARAIQLIELNATMKPADLAD